MAETQRMDFDVMKAQASRIGAEALNVSNGTDSNWDGTARKKSNPNKLEERFNEQMRYYATLFDESRRNLNASLQQLFDGMKDAMGVYAQTEQSITAAMQREDGSLTGETIAAALSSQLNADANDQYQSRLKYEQMEDANLTEKTQAEFNALTEEADKK